jgi:hypothetical protein
MPRSRARIEQLPQQSALSSTNIYPAIDYGIVPSATGDEVRGYTVDDAPLGALSNFIQIRGIEEKLHSTPV